MILISEVWLKQVILSPGFLRRMAHNDDIRHKMKHKILHLNLLFNVYGRENSALPTFNIYVDSMAPLIQPSVLA